MAASWSSNATPNGRRRQNPTTPRGSPSRNSLARLRATTTRRSTSIWASITRCRGCWSRTRSTTRRSSKCDVLVIKIPTTRYTKDEAEAVVRFVQQGGGLLLIGDHTNYEGSATTMNDITRPMGFIFRDDLLFGFSDRPTTSTTRRPRCRTPSCSTCRLGFRRLVLDRSGP